MIRRRSFVFFVDHLTALFCLFPLLYLISHYFLLLIQITSISLCIFDHLEKDSFEKMGESKGYGRGGRVIPNVNSYNVSLQLSPLVSFWDCIVRTMRYSYIPEWL
ncbi:unnamed protein product [Brassica rapa]|uniref:Uncharacterized protein n=3 Tax=Brassica TaxID=3705 RepID=A0A3P5ZTB9_BRACM|nr:unnamed protein product [Brassica napus]CAG7884395.1 unnamed protein product [Brassica rapa]VDC83472.1 unnamed protein product [Brassica rapa]